MALGATMMMLAMQAAAAPTLPADLYEAAQTCKLAVIRRAGQPVSLDQASMASYFAIVATRARPSNDTIESRMGATMRATPARDVPVAAADGLLAQCDRRFPLGRTARVALPGDPAQRELMCLASSAMMMGMAQGSDKDNGTSLAKPLETEMNRWTAAATKRNPTLTAATVTAQILMIADVGHPQAIVARCKNERTS